MTHDEATARFPEALRKTEAAAQAMTDAMTELMKVIEAMDPEGVKAVREVVVPVIGRILERLRAAMT